mmetsp:Transcript_14808/g.32170  ORF Transcript_14808/g.32170 Transcript_14808/m.32170 type:complete len:236 (-) Transcript_14808:393-1100(-)
MCWRLVLHELGHLHGGCEADVERLERRLNVGDFTSGANLARGKGRVDEVLGHVAGVVVHPRHRHNKVGEELCKISLAAKLRHLGVGEMCDGVPEPHKRSVVRHVCVCGIIHINVTGCVLVHNVVERAEVTSKGVDVVAEVVCSLFLGKLRQVSISRSCKGIEETIPNSLPSETHGPVQKTERDAERLDGRGVDGDSAISVNLEQPPQRVIRRQLFGRSNGHKVGKGHMSSGEMIT